MVERPAAPGARAMVQAGADLGPYRLLRRIGAGGMAEVFLAQQQGEEGFRRPVAIKTILAHGAEDEAIGLFLDEARVAGILQHPAIVQTYDLGFEQETLFIVMEYVAGPALSRVLRELKRQGRFLPEEIVAYVGARVASALDFAHRRATAGDGGLLRLVHRDISPQNILLTRAGMVKLSDFGVARASIQTHKTRTGQVRGKAAYMAPEQVRAKALDGRTDTFALALVLYEALTNTRAYQRKTDIQSMRAILTDPVQPLRELNPAVSPGMVAVLDRALAKAPDDRHAHAGELEAALRELHRHVSESEIEQRLAALIDELFGKQEAWHDAEGLPVEAWQPTINQSPDGGGPAPQRLSGDRLSSRIAELLRAPVTSRPPEPAPHELFAAAASGALAPPARAGTALPVAGPSGALGRVPPGETAVGAPLGLPDGSDPGGRGLDASGSISSATPLTQLPTAIGAQPALLRLGVPLVGLLGAVAAGLGVWVLTRTPEPRSEPLAAPPATAGPAAAPRAEAPAARPAEPPPAATPPPPATPIARESPPPTAPRTPRTPTAPRERAAPAVPEPAPAPPATAALDRGAFGRRVFSALQAAKARGDSSRAKQLESLMISVSVRAPTAADQAALEAAEQAARE
jgi:serine/threonine protein kinase